jgi:hypothetical protein
MKLPVFPVFAVPNGSKTPQSHYLPLETNLPEPSSEHEPLYK